MLDLTSTSLKRLGIAWVGNKSRYEGLQLPKQTLTPLHEVAQEILTGLFLRQFEKTEEFFYFHHNEDLSEHPTFQSVAAIFNSPDNMPEHVEKLAQRLYEYSELPKIQGGEFFVAYFDDLLLDGEPVQAIALVKVQSKDTFVKVERTGETYVVNVMEGISTGKLETAALIFNVDESEGYRMCAVDTVSKKDERSFWKDEFLRIRPIEDNYFNTRHYISLTGEFINEKLPHKFGLDRADQLDLLYRSGNYFKDNEYFEIEDFAATMWPESEEIRAAFMEFRDSYAKAYAAPLEDSFEVSSQAVRKEGKALRTTVKLDKNFRLQVSGRRDLLERGYDEDKGKKYYKVYFDAEE